LYAAHAGGQCIAMAKSEAQNSPEDGNGDKDTGAHLDNHKRHNHSN